MAAVSTTIVQYAHTGAHKLDSKGRKRQAVKRELTSPSDQAAQRSPVVSAMAMHLDKTEPLLTGAKRLKGTKGRRWKGS